MSGKGGGNGWEDCKGGISEAAFQRVGMLDLDGKHCGSCGSNSLASAPLASPAPLRTAAESRPLAGRPPARMRHARGGDGTARVAGRRGCRSSLEGQGGKGRLVTWHRHRAQPDWRVAQPSKPTLLGFPGTKRPPPLVRAPEESAGPAPGKGRREPCSFRSVKRTVSPQS